MENIYEQDYRKEKIDPKEKQKSTPEQVDGEGRVLVRTWEGLMNLKPGEKFRIETTEDLKILKEDATADLKIKISGLEKRGEENIQKIRSIKEVGDVPENEKIKEEKISEIIKIVEEEITNLKGEKTQETVNILCGMIEEKIKNGEIFELTVQQREEIHDEIAEKIKELEENYKAFKEKIEKIKEDMDKIYEETLDTLTKKGIEEVREFLKENPNEPEA